LSHRSRLLREINNLQAATKAASPRNFPFPDMLGKGLATPVQQSVSLDQLVPTMISQGAERNCNLQYNVESGMIRIQTSCGPIVIPIDLTPEQAREFAAGLDAAAEEVDPEVIEDPLEDPLVADPVAEALLAEFIENAASSG
jgi:hypothetical protein